LLRPKNYEFFVQERDKTNNQYRKYNISVEKPDSSRIFFISRKVSKNEISVFNYEKYDDYICAIMRQIALPYYVTGAVWLVFLLKICFSKSFDEWMYLVLARTPSFGCIHSHSDLVPFSKLYVPT